MKPSCRHQRRQWKQSLSSEAIFKWCLYASFVSSLLSIVNQLHLGHHHRQAHEDTKTNVGIFSLSGVGGFLVMSADGKEVQVEADGMLSSLADEKDDESTSATKVLELERRAEMVAMDPGATDQERIEAWNDVLRLNPRHVTALLRSGILLLETSSEYHLKELGITRMQKCFFAPKHVDQALPMPSEPGMYLAMLIGRYRWEQSDYATARYFYKMAQQAALAMGVDDTCVATSLATVLNTLPNSTQQEDQSMDIFLKSAQQFLNSPATLEKRRPSEFDEHLLSQKVPGAGDDPYVHCVSTLFQLSFYYRADVALAAKLHNQVAASVWPQLVYVDPVAEKRRQQYLQSGKKKECITRKIRLGIASGFMTTQSSVSADFGGVMQRLNRDELFDVTYIHFPKRGGERDTDPFAFKHADKDGFLLLAQDDRTDRENGAWVTRFHQQIADLKLDVLLYLDLTMNGVATRMAMARLAPVQANSHGHPLTSGVPAVDYFISWGAAELPNRTQAATHYSEELVLLNASVPHQYYTARHTPEGRSAMDGGPFEPFVNRRAFFPNDESHQDMRENGNWYTCMQKPHKFFPSFDPMICGVLQNDPAGHVILHEPDTQKWKNILHRRLSIAGCDMNRVHFLPTQPHHRLLALYKISNVILDSYPAGGCTTTREALELHQVVVTLPARLLGGRWTDAYYQMLNCTELSELVIADSAEAYIQKAVALGTNRTLRKHAQNLIGKHLHRLYARWDAVYSWENTLQQIAPVEIKESCDPNQEE